MAAPKKSALIVVDVQKSFEHRPYWRTDDVPAFAEKMKALANGAKARNVPVVHIFHVDPEDTFGGHFSLSSGLVTRMDFLPEHHDAVFHKSAHNAFNTTGLQRWLLERGTNHLVISGIRTEQCCETTARVASDLGFTVDFVTEATLTFSMRHAGSGREYSSAELKERTELVLDGRFARIATVDECLAGLA